MTTPPTRLTTPHHFPPELLQLLTDVIPRLCRSKQNVIDFFRGAGVPDTLLVGHVESLRRDLASVGKHRIVREVLVALNDRGDGGIAPRREIVRRVVEFEDFSRCWPDDRLEAEGLVSRVRSVVNVKDSFTRMAQERDRERHSHMAEREAVAAATARARQERAVVRDALYRLFAEENAQRRGKALEAVLNDMFRAYGVQVREAFTRTVQSAGVVEQIDGVIALDGHTYLVEMKWWGEPLGPGEVSQHLVRLYQRSDVRGLIISYSDYTPAAIDVCRQALQQRVVALARLQELVTLLDQEKDLSAFLRAKVNAAMLDKNPWYEPPLI